MYDWRGTAMCLQCGRLQGTQRPARRPTSQKHAASGNYYEEQFCRFAGASQEFADNEQQASAAAACAKHVAADADNGNASKG